MISNYNQQLPKDKNIILHIDDNTKKIQTIDGIKIPLYEHQKVLIQQIIDQIKSGYITTHNAKLRNKNIWIKSDIGTGKSLIFLSLIQYFKNNNFKDIPLEVPYKSDIVTTIKKNDEVPFQYLNEQNKSYYHQLFDFEYTTREILKQTGFQDVDCLNSTSIKFKTFQKQALLFVHRQTIEQFQNYIINQTKLTFFTIKDNIDFVKFILLTKEQLEKFDIIIWNNEQTQDIKSVFCNFYRILSEIYRSKPQELQEKTNYIKTTYKFKNMEDVSFDQFMIRYICDKQKAPFAFVAYDDFDTITFPVFKPIPSLVNIFIGSTVIQNYYQNINGCSNFLANDYIQRVSNFRIDPQQLKQILKLPDVKVTEKMCKNPPQLFVQYQLFYYIYNLLAKSYKIYNNQFVPKVLNEQVEFNLLLQHKQDLRGLFNKYICPQRYLIQEEKEAYPLSVLCNEMFSMILQLPYIFKWQHFMQKGNTQKAENLQNTPGMDQLCDIKLYTFTTGQKDLQKIELIKQQNNKYFSIPDKLLEINEIMDPITKNIIKEQDLCISTCCAMCFSKESQYKVVKQNHNRYFCNFCKQQITEIQTYAYHKGDFLKYDELQEQASIEFATYFDGQTKLETIEQIIKTTPGKYLFYVNTDEQEFRQVLSYKLNIPVFYKDEEDFLNKIKKPIILYYQYNGQYQQQIDLIKKNIIFTLVQHRNFLQHQGEKYQRQLQIINNILNKNLIDTIIPKEYPDGIIVKNLNQVVGENLTWIDNFMFIDVPFSTDEYLQIIGRSNRIGRKEENKVFLLYYDSQEKINVNK